MRLAIELASVLKDGGAVFNKIPVKTGNEKPPKKN